MLHDLLARGYFPKELPRPFITASFANVISSATALPGDFANAALTGSKTPAGQAVTYSLARVGLFRRPLSICNPLHSFLLCKEMAQSWSSIQPHVAGTPLAATAPVLKTSGRAIDGRLPQSARQELARDARVGRRYILQTDISRFYESTYTHSLPWALHTKPVAKADRTARLLGNRIDYWVRMGQAQQTVGIPIGPDTSLVLAELIMQRCDEALLARLSNLRGYRLIDDYELCFETRTEAEEAFDHLDTCLSDFELALNPRKTRVLELPQPLEPEWTTQLRRLALSRNTLAGQAADLENYFNAAYRLHSAVPDESVLQYAIAKLRGTEIHPGNWEIFQKLLFLCATPEPACFPYVLEQIIQRTNKGYPPPLPQLEEAANALIKAHSRTRHSSEVANAVWACLALGLRLYTETVDHISFCDDPVVALLALDCEQHGLTSKPLDKSLWASYMTQEALYDDHWLLSYEANVKGWLPTVGGGDHVARDANFGFLKASGVHFYDPSLASPQGAAAVPLPTLPTPSGLEGPYGG